MVRAHSLITAVRPAINGNSADVSTLIGAEDTFAHRPLLNNLLPHWLLLNCILLTPTLDLGVYIDKDFRRLLLRLLHHHHARLLHHHARLLSHHARLLHHHARLLSHHARLLSHHARLLHHHARLLHHHARLLSHHLLLAVRHGHGTSIIIIVVYRHLTLFV